MIPLAVDWYETLPRNANGKLDRERLRQDLTERFADIGLDETACASGFGSDRTD